MSLLCKKMMMMMMIKVPTVTRPAMLPPCIVSLLRAPSADYIAIK